MSVVEPRHYVLRDDKLRNWVAAFVQTAPLGCVVTVEPARRSKAQNRLLHSALNDIAKQVVWHGEQFPMEVWKRLCTAAWLRERGGRPMLVPALDGHGVDVIYEHTSQLSVAECTEFLEWCYAFGAQNGVKFKY